MIDGESGWHDSNALGQSDGEVGFRVAWCALSLMLGGVTEWLQFSHLEN